MVELFFGGGSWGCDRAWRHRQRQSSGRCPHLVLKGWVPNFGCRRAQWILLGNTKVIAEQAFGVLWGWVDIAALGGDPGGISQKSPLKPSEVTALSMLEMTEGAAATSVLVLGMLCVPLGYWQKSCTG